MTEPTIGTRIRNARRAAKMSQAELAALLEVSRQTVFFWESDRAKPDLCRLGDIARELRLRSWEQLLGPVR